MNLKPEEVLMFLKPYLGSVCKGCGCPMETMAEVQEAVWWPHDKGSVGHHACFKAISQNPMPVKHGVGDWAYFGF